MDWNKNIITLILSTIVVFQFCLIFRGFNKQDLQACNDRQEHVVKKRSLLYAGPFPQVVDERVCPPGCRRIVKRPPQQVPPTDQRSHSYSYFSNAHRSGRTSASAAADGQMGNVGLYGHQSQGRSTGQGLSGISGSPGLNGLPGENGVRGRIGQPGYPGERGPRGPPGVNGNQGVSGGAGANGLQGTAGEPGMIGQRGLAGEPGTMGQRGLAGEPGIMGQRGLAGEPGIMGQRGLAGEPGIMGQRGLAGEAGMMGQRGLAGEPGTMGQRGASGRAGDIGLRGQSGSPGLSSGDIYDPSRESNDIQRDVATKELKVTQALQTLQLYNNPNCIDEPNHEKVMNRLNDKGTVSFMILQKAIANMLASSESFHRPDVLLPSELEAYVDALETSTFEELGSNRWIEKHDRIEKLTLQAIVEALSDREEMVKEMLVSRDKLGILVHDLILTELWREMIFPELLKGDPKCSFGIYTILYHEATCVNLIETILFHPETAETFGDAALDLVDYCFRSLNWLLTRPPEDLQEDMDPLDTNLLKQSNSILLRIAFKALTCFRYIIENIDRIHSSVVPRLVVSADAPMLLTEILLQKPWIIVEAKTGNELIYNGDEHRWSKIEPGNRMLIGKIEGQAWLALYQLFKHSRVISSYEIHNYRKNQLMKLRAKLHEVTLDQIPVLAEFSRWLNEVAIASGPIGPTKSPLILEMMAPYRTELEADLLQRKDDILKLQMGELVNASQDLMTEKARRLANTYDFEAFEAVLPNCAKCAACGNFANKRCGRCRNEWYCKRECQVKHWPKHKNVCEIACDSGNWNSNEKGDASS